ncbi:DUF2182 domain-containing protein [Sphingomonas aerolata]|uniref:copper chaperone n=1 Tax=Sphingomonas aerolata TaxID=185951 RepID=UPI002FE12889
MGRLLSSGSFLLQTGYIQAYFLHWTLMIGAMMLPMLGPAARYVRVRSYRRRGARSQALLVAGFWGAWVALGACSLPLIIARSTAAGTEWMSGAVCMLAAAWQLSDRRTAAVRRCHVAPSLRPDGAGADLDCLAYGVRQAITCSRSCLPAMFAMSLSPLGHLAALPMTWLLLRERDPRHPPERWLAALLLMLASASMIAATDLIPAVR